MHKCVFWMCRHAGTITNYNIDLDDSDFLTFSCQHEFQAHEAVSLSESIPVNVQGIKIEETVLILDGGPGSLWFCKRHHALQIPYPLSCNPCPCFHCNHQSALQNEQLSLKQLTSLLQCATVCSRGLVFHIWPKIWISPCWYSWGLLEAPWVFMGQSWSPEIFCIWVLSFGLASACYVFTKLLQPLVKRWRARGNRAIVYIDVGIITSSSKSQSIE